jgi:hypothetical protein
MRRGADDFPNAVPRHVDAARNYRQERDADDPQNEIQQVHVQLHRNGACSHAAAVVSAASKSAAPDQKLLEWQPAGGMSAVFDSREIGTSR